MTTYEKGVSIQIHNTIVSSKALVLVNCTFVHDYCSFFVLLEKVRMYYIRRKIVSLNWSIQSRQLDIELEKVCYRNVVVAPRSVCK